METNTQQSGVLTSRDSLYPTLLKEISGAPLKLFFRGDVSAFDSPLRIAIIGTRKASYEGKEFAKMCAYECARRGITVVSGLALGIDAAAHEGALQANGRTIAVLACGTDIVYPPSHHGLAQKILDAQGIIISEYEQGTPPLPFRFLERNRIVAGLCQAVVVIEAPDRSGALVTARYATDYGREVFVIPGDIKFPNYKGSHQLIRKGARLITSIEDMLEDLAYSSEAFQECVSSLPKKAHIALSPDEQKIIDALYKLKEPQTFDALAEETGLAISTLTQYLTFLTLEGLVLETHGAFTILSH